ncbi:Elongation factor 1-alpha [uncultured archaeon]|nr:Elongation factor 1-alpha [uncultured archaeon]
MSSAGNVTAILGKDLGSLLGKKGAVSDVTLYDHKLRETVLSFVEPSSYPDKIQSLVSAVNMADQVLLKVDGVNAAFAECVVALDALGMRRGYLLFGKDIVPDSVSAFLSGTVVSSYRVLEEQPMLVKEKLAEFKPHGEGDVLVQVDNSFSVRGVGTVALGVVKRGVVRKYDELTIYPSKEVAVVKSIQVHDVDVDEAVTGVRVGLALKDVKPEDIPRGTVFSANADLPLIRVLDAEVSLSKYAKKPISEGDVFLANSFLNYVPAKVAEGSVKPGEKGKIKVELEKDLLNLPGRVVFLDPGIKMPRVFGYAQL